MDLDRTAGRLRHFPDQPRVVAGVGSRVEDPERPLYFRTFDMRPQDLAQQPALAVVRESRIVVIFGQPKELPSKRADNPPPKG